MTLLHTPSATPLPPDASEPVDRRWTREEYDRLTELGLFDGQRIELIEGRIIDMSPQRPPHRIAIELVDRFLRTAFPNDRICIQMPFLSADGSEPEPDIAVVTGDPRQSTSHPASAVLIVEVSDTTLRHDRRKARIYAASGVNEYWILNLNDRSLEVHREPLPAQDSATSPAYGSTRIFRFADSISPLAAPLATTPVAELLP